MHSQGSGSIPRQGTRSHILQLRPSTTKEKYFKNKQTKEYLKRNCLWMGTSSTLRSVQGIPRKLAALENEAIRLGGWWWRACGFFFFNYFLWYCPLGDRGSFLFSSDNIRHWSSLWTSLMLHEFFCFASMDMAPGGHSIRTANSISYFKNRFNYLFLIALASLVGECGL